MTKRLSGKTALITAAAQGIGAATARKFAEESATVIATDINANKLEELSCIEGISTRVLDVTNDEAVIRLVENIPKIDILFNCAGYVHQGTILDCTADDWEFSFNLNLRSMYVLIRACLPGMIARKQGNIINMASVASSLKGVANRFAYGTTKAAVIGLTKSIATDFVGYGLRCNAICPGTIDSPSLRERINEQADPDIACREFMARQPMARIGTTDEVASLAVYLASDESAYTTGTIHVIDGGWSN